MRTLLACLAALVAAGCVAPYPGAPAAPDAPAAPATIPWELRGCRFVVVDLPVEPARLKALLPEGFALAGERAPLSPVTGQGPYLGVEAFACESGTGLAHETVAPVAWASLYTSVVPPAELALEEHLHFVMWDTLVPDAPRREALAARGLPVRDGVVSIEEGPGPAPRLALAFSMEGLGAFRLDAALTEDVTPFGGDFVEYMEARDGGLAAWRTHYEATSARAGRAALQVPAGSWVAGVLGAERAAGFVLAGEWSFTDGAIALPPER